MGKTSLAEHLIDAFEHHIKPAPSPLLYISPSFRPTIPPHRRMSGDPMIKRCYDAGAAGIAAFVGARCHKLGGQPSHGVELSKGARRLLGRTNSVFARTDFFSCELPCNAQRSASRVAVALAMGLH